MSTDIDGGSFVLFGVAAAVIGGTSLFGGRGKMIHALLGGVVIAAVFNGLGLMGIGAAGQDMATAVVLILAVTLDALVRRRSTRADPCGRLGAPEPFPPVSRAAANDDKSELGFRFSAGMHAQRA